MNSWMTCLLGGARKLPPAAERTARVAPAAEDETPAHGRLPAHGAWLTPAGSQTGHHGGMSSLGREPAP